MSDKPIFVVTHPRACSTAFERVFMTRRDDIQCVHEPFGDAFYYGPERLSDRFEDDEQARLDSGFSQSTFKTVLDRLEREASHGKRVFIKDIIHYLLPPNGKPASIAPSLGRIKRGVGTNGVVHGDAPVVDDAAAAAADVNDHPAEENGASSNLKSKTNGASHVKIDSGVDVSATAPVGKVVPPPTVQENGNGTGQNGQNGQNGQSKKPYPYDTEPEPGNPTVMPTAIWAKFHFAFLIRDPHFSVPSYYRCTIPPLDDVTGFHDYDPSEAGYDEVRRTFDFLRNVGLIGPQVATFDSNDAASLSGESDGGLKPVVSGVGEGHESGVEICVVDADEMMEKPAPTMEAFCRSVGLDYSEAMLHWDTDEDHQFACDAFEKWRGFHNDAIESRGLETKEPKPVKAEAQYDAEWREKYGEKAAALIRQTVDANMPDYLYMKQFALRV